MEIRKVCILLSSFALLPSAGLEAGESLPSIHLEARGMSKSCTDLGEALEASRKHGETSGKTITLGEGRYFLEETLVLHERDAGLTIMAKGDANVELIGGRAIRNWEPADGGFWVAELDEVRESGWRFRTLLVNGRVADRARFPANGRLQNLNEWEVRWLSTAEGGWERKPTKDELTRMTYREGDLNPEMKLENAEFTVFHKWDETLVPAKEIIAEDNTVVFSSPVGHPLGAFNVHDYVVWNTVRGMTTAGQWYLDKSAGKLYYWPLPNEDMGTIDVIAPVLESVIRIENTRNIQLKGLHIRAANTPVIVGDFGAKMFPGSISLENASHCRFENLEISGVTGWGLKLFGDHITVRDCHIHHVGAGAIRLIGSHALIDNNYLHHLGLTYPSTIALYVGVTDPNMEDEWIFGKDETHAVISHNEIHDSPYIGIGIGGSHHVVEFNKISRVMLELEDGSGIYATFCADLIMRNNIVRDVEPGKSGLNHAYYLDELSSNVLVEKNISLDVPAASHSHMAEGNTYRNNIFISKQPMTITLPRCGPAATLYDRNVFVSQSAITFVHPNILELKGNLFQAGGVFEQISDRYQRADPVALDLEGKNFISEAGIRILGDDVAFAPDSLAHELGIQEIMGSQAGLRK
jgi:hypothetical protein